jgi:hypothetical protein
VDELEWLKDHSPSTRPSRDTTRDHRTQLRAAIATEGADGGPPHRRPRPRARGRHRVLVTTACVVVLCAIGGLVVALTSAGGDHGSRIGAPVASGATTTTTKKKTECSGPPPAQLAIPSGFSTGRAGPAAGGSEPAPTSTQQVTTWTSDGATIEQRWPSDANRRPWDQTGVAPDGVSGITEDVIVDADGGAHRTLLFGFPNQPKGCETLQITVSGSDAATVRSVSDGLVQSPFVSPEPVVATSRAATAIPAVVACEATATATATASSAVDGISPAATVDGTATGAAFGRPGDALVSFLAGEPRLFQHGYDELHLADGSVTYVKQVRPGVVVTAVHVTAAAAGWSVNDWKASGC